ncbi:MAG TPA: universal stress protein [Burkholderiaceae bacterium]|nr:universal stress protein [Burkholderiaceae bacterium]HQR76885.1 universal stress protein [Burkholderiaceae bacterium]
MFNGRVLVATDGSPLSERAVKIAAELARNVGAKLTAVTVAAPYPYSALGESSAIAGADYQSKVGAEASARLARASEIARAAGADCATSLQESADVYRGILAAAEQGGAGLIVMASHGRQGLTAVVLGSETQRVLAHTELPVLIVR